MAIVYKSEKETKALQKKLKAANVKSVAIAPRLESYRENMILGVFELLCNLDDDPQLDAYPGILIASDADKFDDLIDRSINYSPKEISELKPMASCMVPGLKELRSLQKNGIIHNYFAQYNLDAPILNLVKSDMGEIPQLTGANVLNYDMGSARSLKVLPKKASEAFADASFLVLHGHGIPGTSCGIDIEAIPADYKADIVICGSCFSAAPQKSDFPAMRKSPDGQTIERRQSFALRALDNGATVVYGHMRLNAGFPRLFPLIETLMDGRSVGEAYQENINTSLKMVQMDSHKLALRETPENPRRIKQNNLLYVVFGDPALRPIIKN